MIKSAELSEDRMYRYSLSRSWDSNLPYVVFIGLNPSTADETEDDPTIRRCIGYAKAWGYGGIVMLNLFALRATEPRDMMVSYRPVGSKNNSVLIKYSYNLRCHLYIAAWGNHGVHRDRYKEARIIFDDLHYLKLNKSGQPAHPLYLKADLKPTLWEYDDE